MGKQIKKIKDSCDIFKLKKKYNLYPKSKCPCCRRYTIYKDEKFFYECVWCGHKIAKKVI